jgi:DNA end-binding protein Ku
LNRKRIDWSFGHGGTRLLEGADQAGAGLDPRRNLLRDKSGATIAFNQIHEPTGKRIKYEKVVPGVGAVPPEEIVKGYQVEKGNYVLIDDDEIEAVKLESKKTLELTQFVDHDEIDVLYYEKPYFVVPADDLAEEAFVVLREALRRTKKVALGQLALRGREYIVSLKPCGRGIVLETLRYADEVHKAQNYFREIQRRQAGRRPARSGRDPDREEDGAVRCLPVPRPLYRRAARADRAQAPGQDVQAADEPAPARGSNVVDLMAALKRSLEKSGGGAETEPAPAKKPAGAKAAAKKPPARSAPRKEPARKRA